MFTIFYFVIAQPICILQLFSCWATSALS